MARPEIIKTELGRRLREVRKSLGDIQRAEFAKELGINEKSLANYERGDRVPDADVLKAYCDRYQVDATWLVSGLGKMFFDSEISSFEVCIDPTVGSAGFLVHATLLVDIADIVQETYKANGSEPSVAKCVSEAVVRYGELTKTAKDPSDEAELRALFPWLQLRISQELDKVRIKPSSGS